MDSTAAMATANPITVTGERVAAGALLNRLSMATVLGLVEFSGHQRLRHFLSGSLSENSE